MGEGADRITEDIVHISQVEHHACRLGLREHPLQKAVELKGYRVSSRPNANAPSVVG
jgi:hypothetical protein